MSILFFLGPNKMQLLAVCFRYAKKGTYPWVFHYYFCEGAYSKFYFGFCFVSMHKMAFVHLLIMWQNGKLLFHVSSHHEFYHFQWYWISVIFCSTMKELHVFFVGFSTNKNEQLSWMGRAHFAKKGIFGALLVIEAPPSKWMNTKFEF